MIRMRHIIVFLVSFTFSSIVHHIEANDLFYTAAVYEHSRFGNKSDSPGIIVNTNLKFYERAAEIARAKGADVILYPEYGIFPPWNRSEIKDFLENIPNPTKTVSNPCEETDAFAGRPILRTLSCIAKSNSMFVVANMGDIQNCSGLSECPEDGVFHFNANVVFSRNGSLILKYHKEHLFYEWGMDLAREQQNSTFETDFGTFATYICFDIDFGRMSEVARWPSVDGVMFSTMFVDQPPQMTSVQYWQSWALGNNATILAANIQIPGFLAVGSGIFTGNDGSLAYTFNPDGISKLVVARVPKSNLHPVPPEASITAINETSFWDFREDGKDVPEICEWKLLNDSVNIYKDYRCVTENYTEYTFKQLQDDSGHVEACSNGLCCSLYYKTKGLTDRYFLGVFNNTYRHFDRYEWHEEDCVLARCDALKNNTCGNFPMKTETIFRYVRLTANFSSTVVYPSVVESGMRLAPLTEWYHQKEDDQTILHFGSESGKKLLVVGMKGRRYDLDPPYVR